MVHILSTGEIVQDDDPRVKHNQSQRTAAASAGREGEDHLQRGHNAFQEQAPGPNAGRTNQVSLVDALNLKLVRAGFPRWRMGTHTVEPIMSVAVLLSLLMFGLPGLLLIAILFFVVQLSQYGSVQATWRSLFGGGSNNAHNSQDDGSGQNNLGHSRRGPRGGGGQRLGR